MSLILDGTNGLSDVDGSAATPAIRGTDTNTGMFFPAADTIAFSEGGVESMRIDSSGRLLVGTTTALANSIATFGNNTATPSRWGIATVENSGGVTPPTSAGLSIGWNYSNGGGENNIVYGTTLGSTPALAVSSFNGTTVTERMRIDSSGNLLVGTTSNPTTNRINVSWDNASFGGMRFSHASSTYNQSAIEFYNASSTRVGFIYANASSTQYSTSSDYRLKENIAPMTGALAKVALLKPCTYTWKADGSVGQGFIAHELQAVVPDAVVGEKDAVDAEGNPKYQGVDTSFLVATLTAAIQELKAEVDSLKAQLNNTN